MTVDILQMGKQRLGENNFHKASHQREQGGPDWRAVLQEFKDRCAQHQAQLL